MSVIQPAISPSGCGVLASFTENIASSFSTTKKIFRTYKAHKGIAIVLLLLASVIVIVVRSLRAKLLAHPAIKVHGINFNAILLYSSNAPWSGSLREQR